MGKKELLQSICSMLIASIIIVCLYEGKSLIGFSSMTEQKVGSPYDAENEYYEKQDIAFVEERNEKQNYRPSFIITP